MVLPDGNTVAVDLCSDDDRFQHMTVLRVSQVDTAGAWPSGRYATRTMSVRTTGRT